MSSKKVKKKKKKMGLTKTSKHNLKKTKQLIARWKNKTTKQKKNIKNKLL